MSITFRIQELELRTAFGSSTYQFQSGLNVITGSYGTGKSSMLELIKYALGSSSVEIMPAIEANLTLTRLRVIVGRTRLVIDREFGKNRLQVSFVDDDSHIEEWSATRIKTVPLVSDRLLELLNIPLTRLARRGAGGSSVSVSFFDFFRYMYLPQADVPRSIAGHADPFLNPKRKAVLELAYGLSDSVVTVHEIATEDLRKELATIKTETAAIKRFLEASGAPERDSLTELAERARHSLAATTNALAEVRRSASEAATVDDQRELRERIADLRLRSASASTEAAAAAAVVDRGVAVVAQLTLDIERQLQSGGAGDVFADFEYELCPRCMQDLPVRTNPHSCVLCGQHEQEVHEGPADTGRRLELQLHETEEVLESDRERLDAARVAHDRLRADLAWAVSDFETQLDPALLLPALDSVSNAAADVERNRALVRDLERFEDQWDLYQINADQQGEVERKISDTQEAAAKARENLDRNRYKITSLSERFDEEIRGLGFSDYNNAGVDPSNYLPVINGEPFERLSVAGARKVLANDAYYLAILGNALSDRDISMPGFLMIDGPRTSLGSTPDDVAAGNRLYYRLSLLAQAYPDAQIIVADNGVPSDSEVFGRDRPTLIELTYDRPLLQDVAHPGQGSVPTIGS